MGCVTIHRKGFDIVVVGCIGLELVYGILLTERGEIAGGEAIIPFFIVAEVIGIEPQLPAC